MSSHHQGAHHHYQHTDYEQRGFPDQTSYGEKHLSLRSLHLWLWLVWPRCGWSSASDHTKLRTKSGAMSLDSTCLTLAEIWFRKTSLICVVVTILTCVRRSVVVGAVWSKVVIAILMSRASVSSIGHNWSCSSSISAEDHCFSVNQTFIQLSVWDRRRSWRLHGEYAGFGEETPSIMTVIGGANFVSSMKCWSSWPSSKAQTCRLHIK